jgi:hypothetical protein
MRVLGDEVSTTPRERVDQSFNAGVERMIHPLTRVVLTSFRNSSYSP